jgi:ATP-dependent DNA helicase RecG
MSTLPSDRYMLLSMVEQLQLFPEKQRLALMSPSEIFAALTPELIAQAGENRRIERKSARDIDFQDYAANYSAFSNTPEGGVMVIGIENNGAESGCNRLSHEQLNNIENFHRSLCPLARPEFRRIEIAGGTKFAVAIFIPYIGQLVETNKNEAWIRYGDKTVKMSEAEKADFRATRQQQSFELQDVALRFPDDFDGALLDAFVAKFKERGGPTHWSRQEILVDRCLGRLEKGQFLPNNALAMLAARQPGRIIPGCRVRVQRFAGTAEGSGPTYNPIRDRFFEGNIVRIIQDSTLAMHELNYDVTWLTPEGKFETVSEYPQWAWTEALVNACVHRSYHFSGTDVTVKFFEDRLEIESPGGFVPPVHEENIYQVRAARNPHLMDALRILGYVQMAREGTRRMRESMVAFDLPEPTFKQESVNGVVVRVTLRNDHAGRKRTTNRDVAEYYGVEAWKTLESHEISLLAYAYRNGTINVSEAQRLTGRTWATSRKDLSRLVAKRFLTFQPGAYARDPKAHYKVAPRQSGNPTAREGSGPAAGGSIAADVGNTTQAPRKEEK